MLNSSGRAAAALAVAVLLLSPVSGQECSEASSQKRTADTESWVRSKKNISRIALAMHEYHNKHGHFPPAVSLGPDGKTPHSWRVELLPFVGASEIYDKYRMDEPWDSEQNEQILKDMPAVFRSPVATRDSINTAYFVFAGTNSITDHNAELQELPVTPPSGFSNDPLFSSIPGKNGPKIFEATDRSSLTILIVEAKRAIPWTKPEDIPFDYGKKLPELAGYWGDGFWVAFADGSAQFIAEEIDAELLKQLIMPADGHRIGEIPTARYELQFRLRER